ncbi:P-loop NTPase family protein [Vibrio panuliri]|uniref:Helicase HerA central domain-containing protein n=1 Tax=Vibrio panuliri TaxID=1381081 RepID=A0ABX3FHW4_9VIBR|nr:hypothetical protein [Vibrio panuliri]KAB1457399.1 hypothetical protein F7O85_06560 [Vibrio panuliri]OLQ91440.1 hypothetical protein BIY20_01120 [Vibrio panuliri]
MAKKAKPSPLRFPNPVNSNASLDPKHTIYVAGTGGGKTSAIFHMDTIPKKSQVVIFDPYSGYVGKKLKGQLVVGTSSRMLFVKSLVTARKQGKPFKLAYLPLQGACAEELEFFSAAVWSVGNGRSCELHTVIEELASCIDTAGKLQGKPGELLRGGRQFGIVVHTLFQKPQEVPKTVTDQSDTWWIGKLNSGRDINWMVNQRDIDERLLASLISAKQNMKLIGKPIAEYLISDDIGQAQKAAFHCVTGQKYAR